MKNTNKTLVLSISIGLLNIPYASAQEMGWSIESGIGYETNVYHSPDKDYIDTSLPSTRPAGIAVSPDPISSLFIPVEAEFYVRNPMYDNADFVTAIQFDTDFMVDSDADDATRSNVTLEFGSDIELVKWKRDKKKNDFVADKQGDAYVGGFISTHNQVYVDRDTGLPKTTAGGTDISDKYSYQSFGIKANYEREVGKAEYLAEFIYEDLNYDSPQTGAEYDHIFTKYLLGLKYELSRSTDIKAEYSFAVRDYSDRYARDLNGTYSSANNELLKYKYNTLNLQLSHRFTRELKSYFQVKNVSRKDDWLGYNDYDRTDIELRASYKYSDKTKIRAGIESIDYKYDNAFNYEDPSRGIKDSSGTGVKVKVIHKWHKHKTYYAEFEHKDRESTDERYDYTDDVFMLGAKWEY